MSAAKPTVAERAAQRLCPECAGQVVRRSPKGPMPTFCSKECKTSHSNRHIVEGRAVIALLKAWRIDRGTGEIAKGAFQQVCTIVDGFNADDNAAGRPRADLYAVKVLATGTQYIDRRRTA